MAFVLAEEARPMIEASGLGEREWGLGCITMRESEHWSIPRFPRSYFYGQVDSRLIVGLLFFESAIFMICFSVSCLEFDFNTMI